LHVFHVVGEVQKVTHDRYSFSGGWLRVSSFAFWWLVFCHAYLLP
jgi:hypothetical protein